MNTTNAVLLFIAFSVSLGFYHALNLLRRIADALTEIQHLSFSEIKRQRGKGRQF
jgi:hypothetical protein